MFVFEIDSRFEHRTCLHNCDRDNRDHKSPFPVQIQGFWTLAAKRISEYVHRRDFPDTLPLPRSSSLLPKSPNPLWFRTQISYALCCALLIAYGITESGRRCVLGVSVELSEAEVHWRKFLESLIARGLHGLKLIVSANHVGLKAARMRVFPSVPWQRCQFHLQQNATAHIPRKSMQQEVHNDIRDVFNMPTRSDAEIQLKKLIEKYGKKAPDLSSWLENELPEGFTVFNVEPDSLNARRKLRTTNMVEFQNKVLKKRTRCIRVFPWKHPPSSHLLHIPKTIISVERRGLGSCTPRFKSGCKNVFNMIFS